MNPKEIDPHTYPGPLEELEKHKQNTSNKPGNQRKATIFVIAMSVMLMVGALVAYLVYSEGGFEGAIDEDPTAFIPFIPVWIAIFVPFMVAKKNKKKRILIALLVLGIVSLVGLTIFLSVQEF